MIRRNKATGLLGMRLLECKLLYNKTSLMQNSLLKKDLSQLDKLVVMEEHYTRKKKARSTWIKAGEGLLSLQWESM